MTWPEAIAYISMVAGVAVIVATLIAATWVADKRYLRKRAVYREGYAQALRDVLTEMEQEFEPRLAAWFRDWAADRGVQLESESEKTP